MRELAMRVAVLIATVLIATSALADDWNVTRQRGDVSQLVAGSWQPLPRGSIVPDDRRIRTGSKGFATLVRGRETITLGPNSEIRIVDEGGTKPHTTVEQAYGTVEVEAEVRQVEHFAVRNAYLAAVVKGTRFTVSAGKTGASVTVQRGHVAVEKERDRTHVTIGRGQAAVIDTTKMAGALEVKGEGKLPSVLDRKGKQVPPGHAPKVKGPKSTGPKAGTSKGEPAAPKPPKATPPGQNKPKPSAPKPNPKPLPKPRP